ncbi:MAG: hypothetical protein CMF74_01115 [Maricaulis sp.]|jgi:membrane fusion protein (multidrug efflux system)|nr:hypothetical protein [Maricaulis sp.]
MNHVLRPILLIGLVTLALTACGAPQPAAPAAISAEVSTAPVTVQDLAETVTGFGSVVFDPSAQHTFSADIEARVIDLQVRAGERVETGAVLLRLEPSSTTAVELSRARNDLIAARAASARAQRLRQDGLASDADVEAAENQRRDLETLVSSLERSTRRISELAAVESGVVDTIFVAPGDLVSSGQTLVRLSSLEQLLAAIQLEIEDVTRIAVGDPVQLHALDNSGAEVTTQVRLIDIRVDPASRTTTVFADLHGVAGFLPGQAVRAEITAEVHHQALTVPRRAVLYDETGAFVYVVANGSARLQRIEVGVTTTSVAEVTSGLDASQTVAVEGAATLSDGMQIRTAADPATNQ